MGESVESSLPVGGSPLQIGWARCEITPEKLPVQIWGQFYARVSEGVADPLTATVLALSSGSEQVIFVSCDLINIPDELRDKVRSDLQEAATGYGIDPMRVIFNATHTHAGPEMRHPGKVPDGIGSMGSGVELGTAPLTDTINFTAKCLADCVAEAWKARKPGKVAYGLDDVVIGRNRRWVDKDGHSTMYGLNKSVHDSFRHIEGYEDHSLNLMATYDEDSKLTGVVVNLACTSQESQHSFLLSADFWCEVREELALRLDEGVYVLPQCSASGELTSQIIHGTRAYVRMLELRGCSPRREIGQKIAETVCRILPAIENTPEGSVQLSHTYEILELPMLKITAEQAEAAKEEGGELDELYRSEIQKLESDPGLKSEPRWYVPVSKAFRRRNWVLGTVTRYEKQQRGENLTRPVEVHTVRIGEIAFATNPFEYYLDFGMQIKIRSPFIQTFLVQLAGGGTYVPSPRSVQGGGYGSVPASNPVGPEGGQILAEETVRMLRSLS